MGSATNALRREENFSLSESFLKNDGRNFILRSVPLADAKGSFLLNLKQQLVQVYHDRTLATFRHLQEVFEKICHRVSHQHSDPWEHVPIRYKVLYGICLP